MDVMGFPVQADSLPKEQPAVAAAGGSTIMAFSTFRPENPYGAVRIGLRQIAPSLSGVSDGSVRTGDLVRLFAPSPNPVGVTTILRFELARSAEVRIEIFDLHGRKLRTLLNEIRSPGTHDVAWDTRVDSGEPVPSGIYMYRVEASGSARTGKVTIIR